MRRTSSLRRTEIRLSVEEEITGSTPVGSATYGSGVSAAQASPKRLGKVQFLGSMLEAHSYMGSTVGFQPSEEVSSTSCATEWLYRLLVDRRILGA